MVVLVLRMGAGGGGRKKIHDFWAKIDIDTFFFFLVRLELFLCSLMREVGLRGGGGEGGVGGVPVDWLGKWWRWLQVRGPQSRGVYSIGEKVSLW